MKTRKTAILGVLAALVIAIILFDVVFTRHDPKSISIRFIGFTNIGPRNASVAMYVVTNHATESFAFVGFKFLVKTNFHWVEERRAGPAQIPWEVERLLSGTIDGNGQLSAQGSFNAFLPSSPGVPPRKALLCFTAQGTRPIRVPPSSPSVFGQLCEEVGAKVDGVLHRELECPVPDPVK
jgi:hypothetical protein